MKTFDLRNELHKQIDSLDKAHLNYLYGNLQNLIQGDIDGTVWENMPDEQRLGIMQGVEQAENGKVTNHDDVMRNIKKEYGIV